MDERGTVSEVTAFVIEWITARRAEGKTFKEIADMIGVTKTQVIHVHGGSRGVGQTMETSFARRHYGGSLDALRKAAHDAAEARANTEATVPLPENLRSAIEMVRTRHEVSPSTIALARTIASRAGDLSIATWVAVLVDMATLPARDGKRSGS